MCKRCFGWTALVCLTIVAVAGCGGGDPLARQAVSGTVTFKGQPLDKGTITFLPADPQGKGMGGATITNGQFSLPAAQGLPPGRYRVQISSPTGGAEVTPGEAPGESSKLAEERIPASWNTESKHEITVEKGGANKFDFHID